MKRLGKSEIRKSDVIIFRDYYMYKAGYRVERDGVEIGYITFNTFMKLNTFKASDYYGVITYLIKE